MFTRSPGWEVFFSGTDFAFQAACLDFRIVLGCKNSGQARPLEFQSDVPSGQELICGLGGNGFPDGFDSVRVSRNVCLKIQGLKEGSLNFGNHGKWGLTFL